jgi:signal transduction histidine kinase
MAAVRHTILVIDDDDLVLDLCTVVLEGQGHAVSTARDGTRGIAVARRLNPDMVFVDLRMPGPSGLQVIEEIHEIDPTTVVVLMTGHATIDVAVDAMKLGAYDVVGKPFKPEELKALSRRGLEKRRLELETIALRREQETLRENFAAIVSHELKSPLGAVQQNLFLLEHELAGAISEDQQGRIGRMQVRIGQLVDMVNAWLRGVSVDVRSIREGFKPLPISAVVERAVENTEPQAVRKDIEVATFLETPGPTVFGDDTTLTEALTNILGNAVKYSYDGGRVTVTVATERGDTTIEIGDTGVGISKEDCDRIFGDFYRAGDAGVAGAGLGLAISRRIVEAHDGTITVESEPGKGSTFRIVLPLHRSDTTDEAPGPAMAQEHGGVP